MKTTLREFVPKIWPFPNLTLSKKFSVQTVQAEPFRINGVGNLRALAALGENIAWVGGTEGKIAKTEDEGKTWSLCSLPDEEGLDVRALYLCNPKVACAMCAGPAEERLSRIYRTVDGGKHWNLVFCPEIKGVFFNAMVFWNEKHGIVLSDPVEGRFILFRTEDGGESWSQVVPVEMPFAMPGEAAFAASNSCLTVRGAESVWFATGGGPSARVFHSSDGGRYWSAATTPMEINSPSAGIFSLAFLNNNIGIAVGGDCELKTSFPNPNIMITRDGGRNWEILVDKTLAGKYLSSVAWAPEDTAKVIDCSQGVFNSIVMTPKGGWAVGRNQACARFLF